MSRESVEVDASLMTSPLIETDELGPEVVLFVSDPETGMRGLLVVDCSVLGPCGGGTRMMPDLTPREVADLARSMTYKFGILGLPRGGSKAGLWGDPSCDPEEKRRIMRAFGRRLKPFLQSNYVAVGPDMGVTVNDLTDVYEGANVVNARSGLFARLVENDPAAYHITGFGVATSIRAALGTMKSDMAGARVAIEGFGQVGAGTARYVDRFGGKVVAISTLQGAIYNPDGLDVARLLELRRSVGDDCVLSYEKAERIPLSSLYFLPVDVVVPGARPYVIHEGNIGDLNTRAIVSGANIAVTRGAYEALYNKGVVIVPDFISNAGAAVASWVDFLAGDFDQALTTIDRLLGHLTTDVLQEAEKTGRSPYTVATDRVKQRIQEARGQPPKSFEQIKVEIRQLFGM